MPCVLFRAPGVRRHGRPALAEPGQRVLGVAQRAQDHGAILCLRFVTGAFGLIHAGAIAAEIQHVPAQPRSQHG
jgi:hypothetical protein